MNDNLPARLQAIRYELDRDTGEYVRAKTEYDQARVRFEAARDRFKATKQLASEMMTSRDWWAWGSEHPDVKYAGTGLGDAINDSLEHVAFQAATRTVREKKKFWPYAALDDIACALEEGGFDFHSSTPLREVNAALINLAGVKKHETLNNYAAARADEILGFVRSTDTESTDETEQAEEVPFE